MHLLFSVIMLAVTFSLFFIYFSDSLETAWLAHIDIYVPNHLQIK